MRLLKRKPRTFEIQVQDMTLHIQAATDVDEESRAAALSFWEVLHAYSIRDPAFRESKRPVKVPEEAPDIVREMAATAGRAGVGPMYSFQGAVTDHVGRFLAREVNEVTVNCGGDYFIRSRKRQKLTVVRRPGSPVAIVVPRSGASIDAADVIAFTRDRLAHYKCPTDVQVIDALPRNPSGKVLKRELRKPYWAGHDRSIG